MAQRILLLILSILTTLALGLFIPFKWLDPVLHYSGYYFILFAFFLWVFLILKISCDEFRSLLKSHYPAILLSLGLMCLVFYSHPPRFKILADEANLVGVSMAMYEDKTISLPIEGLMLDYTVFNPSHKLDKRPLLFPFLISLTHSLLGYSPYNGYVVNFILGISILFIVYLLISFYFSKFYGILGIFILSSYPIFIIWVTSSGFDILNLFFILFLLLILCYFLQNPNHDYAELFFLSIVLLAQCRYESLFFFLVLIFFLPNLINDKLVFQYRFITFISPLLLLPLIWQRRLFSATYEPVRIGHQLFESADQLFNCGHLAANLSKNIFVLSGMDSRFGFLPLITILAILGSYLLLKRYVLEFSSVDKRIKLFSFVGVFFILSLFVIHSLYFWGDYTSPISNRFALIFPPFLIIAALFFMYQLFKKPSKYTKVVIILLACVQLLYYRPVAAKQWLLQGLSLTHEYNKITSYLYSSYDMKSDNLLLISDLPNLYLIHDVGSISFDQANDNLDKINFLLQTYYDQVIVFQRCALQDDKPEKKNTLRKNFQLNQVGRINISSEFFIRIYEVNKIL
jgi:dolichyl-phosphate-mannose-protein mannosyltransferase